MIRNLTLLTLKYYSHQIEYSVTTLLVAMIARTLASTLLAVVSDSDLATENYVQDTGTDCLHVDFTIYSYVLAETTRTRQITSLSKHSSINELKNATNLSSL